MQRFTRINGFDTIDTTRYRFLNNDLDGKPRVFYNEEYDENLILECSLPKLLYRTNIFEISSLDKNKIIEILNYAVKRIAKNAYDIGDWRLTRIDYVTSLKLEQIKPFEIIEALSKYDILRMKIYRHGRNETVTWRSPSYAIRIYDKQKEFKQHDFKYFRNNNEEELAEKYLPLCSDVVRHEVQLSRKEVIDRFIPEGKFVNAFDDEIVKDVILHSLNKLGISKESNINNEKHISDFLYRNFRHDKAENLEDFIAVIKCKGKEYAKKCYPEVSYKRYWNICKRLGILSIIKGYDYFSNICQRFERNDFTNCSLNNLCNIIAKDCTQEESEFF